MIVRFNNTLAKVKTNRHKFTIVKMGPAKAKYHVALSSNDEQMGITSGSGTYVDGSYAQIHAYANNGYLFSHWSDGDTNASTLSTNGQIEILPVEQ